MGVSTWKASRRGQRRRCGASWAQTKIADRQSKMAENKKCLISAIVLRLNVYINTNDTHINTGFNLFSKENSYSVLLSHFFVVPLRPQKIKILNRHIVLKTPIPISAPSPCPSSPSPWRKSPAHRVSRFFLCDLSRHSLPSTRPFLSPRNNKKSKHKT